MVKFKRTLSVMSAVAMLAAVMPVQAFAAGIPIKSINISYDMSSLPKEGWTVADSPATISLVPGCGYSITSYSYQIVDKSQGDLCVDMGPEDVFKSDEKYYLYMELASDDDRYFDIESIDDVMVNSVFDDYDFEMTGEHSAFLRYPIDPQTTYYIVGEAGAKITAEGWSGSDNMVPLVKGDTFSIEAPEAPEGCRFDRWLEFDDADNIYVPAESLYIKNQAKTTGTVSEGGKKYYPVFKRVLGSIDFKFEEPYAGSSVFSLPNAPEGSNIKVQDALLTDKSGNIVKAFEMGKEYKISMELVADEGYVFDVKTHDSLSLFTLNGKKAEGVTLYNFEPEKAEVRFKFTVNKQAETLDDVQLDFKMPGIGKDRTNPPEFSYDEDKINVSSPLFLTDDGTDLVEGKEYTVIAVLFPDNGYCFDIDQEDKTVGTKVYVNGEEAKLKVSEENPYSLLLEYKFTYSHKAVESVNLDFNVPEVGTEGNALPFVTTAPGSHYNVKSAFFSDINGNPFTSAMENGMKYNLTVVLESADGYVFDLANSYSINGNEVEYLALDEDGNVALLYQFKVGEIKNIEKAKIEFTPLVGDGTLGEPQLTPFESEQYEVVALDYLDQDGNKVVGSPDEKGIYFIVVQLRPKTGYEFNSDTVYTMNDKDPDKIVSGGILGDDVIIAARVYPYGQTKFMLGDVDLNGSIDIEDAVHVINMINGNNLLTGDSLKAADCNGDGNVDIEDAVMIINQINGVSLIPQPK